MSAAYDNYHYPSYWRGRDYEHDSEVYAIRRLLRRIPKVDCALEIGAGYGRLTPEYSEKANKVILSDPSGKILKLARSNHPQDKFKFVQSSLENLKGKIPSQSVDLVLMIRVLHHIQEPENSFKQISYFLKPGSYFILEYANKMHFKANFKEFCHGNFTFPIDIGTKDIRSKKSIKDNTLPFYNFHPYVIEDYLKKAGFTIIEKRSVSNIRNNFIKRIIPTVILVSFEKLLQNVLASVNFGPSIFILARKRG